jgi:hypothetical protein
MRALLAFLAVLVLPSPAPARAQDLIALQTSAEDGMDVGVEVAREARRALGARSAAAAAASCDPFFDVGCAERLLRGTGASRLLVVRTRRFRRCAEIVRDGVRVGHRTGHVPGVALSLFGADGALLGTTTLIAGGPDPLVDQVAPAIDGLLAAQAARAVEGMPPP